MTDEHDWIAEAARKPTPALLHWMAGWKRSTPQYLAAQYVLAQRKAHGTTIRGWIALTLSILSFLLSLLALLR